MNPSVIVYCFGSIAKANAMISTIIRCNMLTKEHRDRFTIEPWTCEGKKRSITYFCLRYKVEGGDVVEGQELMYFARGYMAATNAAKRGSRKAKAPIVSA